MAYKSLTPANNDVSVNCRSCGSEYRINLYKFNRDKVINCEQCNEQQNSSLQMSDVSEVIQIRMGQGHADEERSGP